MLKPNQWQATVNVRNPDTDEISAIGAYGSTPEVVRENIAILLRRKQGCSVSQLRSPHKFVLLPDAATIEDFIQHDLIIAPAPA